MKLHRLEKELCGRIQTTHGGVNQKMSVCNMQHV